MDCYIIDRFEGEFAVCEKNGDETVNIPRSLLPCGVREGSVLRRQCGGPFERDEEQERLRRERIRALEESLFDE